MSTANKIRILLVEDHPLTGEHLYAYLRSFENLHVVGRAQDGLEAVLQAGKLRPTVVLMDVNLPKMDGIAATREIKTKHPEIVVVGLTFRDEDYIRYAMCKAGAIDIVAKENLGTVLYSTIQRAIAAVHPIVIMEGRTVNDGAKVPLGDSSQLPMDKSSQLSPSATTGANDGRGQA